MRELRQLVAYLCGLVLVAASLYAVVVVAALEGVDYIPETSSVSAVKKEPEPGGVQIPISTDRGNVIPVWIAPTPKYDYDPELMIVKPLEERLKEAELRRKQQAAQYAETRRKQAAQDLTKLQARRRAHEKLAKQRHEQQLRENGTAYAYQPEVKPVFGLFSIFR
jgi:hypothetical protein